MLAEIAEIAVSVEELSRRLGDHDLAAVTGARDPRALVDVEADIALAGHGRLAGVDPDPNPHGSAVERGLAFCSRGHGVGRAREGYEERIALGVDLDAVVPRERVAEHPAVLGEDVRVAVTDLLEQARRPFDVGEEERDRPARKLPHADMIPRGSGSAKLSAPWRPPRRPL